MRDHDTETYQDFLKDFQPGAPLGTRYRIVKSVGAGGMGRVFLAHDIELNMDVALKVIRPELLQSENALERFKNELVIARKVSHKNIVRIHDIGEIRGLKYLTMSYIQGNSLRDILRQSGALETNRAVSIFTQICEGVAAAHEESVIHRDLKPANVMLDENDRVYITDFGIAKLMDSADQTRSGVIVGTPAYLSPEQAWGEKPDARSDIYALGLILYELLSGELPFDHETVQSFKSRFPVELEKKLRKLRPETPRYLISMIQKCLDPNRSTRYQTVAAILSDLRNEDVVTRFRWKKYIPIAAAVLLAALAIVWQMRRPHLANPPPETQTAGQTTAVSRKAVILPFRNKTGKQDMDWIESTMSELLISDLAQQGNLQVVNPERVFQTLADLKIPAGPYDQDAVKRLSQILDADLVVQGSVTQAGSVLRADVQVNDANHPDKTAYFKATGTKQEDLLPMVDQLAQQIQKQLKSDVPMDRNVAATTTASIPAWKAFHQGAEYFRQENYAQASESFQNSIRSDPKFSKAYLRLSEAYERMGRQDEAIQVLQKAIEKDDPRDEKTGLMIRARFSMLKGELDNAIKIYQTIREKHPNDPEILFNLADLYEQNGDLKNAVAALENVIRIDPNHPQAYYQLGKDVIMMGDPERAISQYLIKALSIQTQLQNRYAQADVLNAMGVAYERLGRYNDAIKYYSESLTAKEEVGNKTGAATSLTNIAKINIFQGEYDKAKKMLNKALGVYQELNDSAGVADVMNTFGVINENQGHYDQALKYYKNSLQIRKEIGDDQMTAESYDNIGHIYYLSGNYDEAQAFWEQALGLRKRIGEQDGIILSIQNLGFLQIAQGQLDKALKSFLDALNQSRSIQFANAIAVSLGNLGTIYQNQGRYSAALDSYQEALDVLEKLDDKKGKAEYTKWMASTFLEVQEYAAATGKLNHAMELAKEIQSSEIIADVCVLLGRLHRMQSDLVQAQKDVESAEKNAANNNYKSGLLAAKIEKGRLLQASGRSAEASSLLKAAVKQATESSDVWLILASKYALASSYMADAQPKAAIQVCLDALPLATRMGVKPYLYRFHSIAGQGYQNLKDKRALEHFREAVRNIEEIKKSIKAEHTSSFLQVIEVKKAYDGVKSFASARE